MSGYTEEDAERLAATWAGWFDHGLTHDPEAASLLHRILIGPARLHLYDRLRRDRLWHLLDADLVPSEALPALAATVGWGVDLPYVGALTEDQLRRLVAVALELWQAKGTEDSWRGLLAQVAGAPVQVVDWFQRRAHTGTHGGVALVPGLSTSAPGAGPYSYPEHVTDVWIEDPEGSQDLDLLAGLLDRLRGAGERINILRALWVDDGTKGLGRYAGFGGLALDGVSHDREAGKLEISSGSAVATASYAFGYEAVVRVIQTSGTAFAFYVGADTGDGWRVMVWASGLLELYRASGGTSVLLASSTWAGTLQEWTAWRLGAQQEAGGVRFRLWYDSGTKVLDHLDVAPHRSTGAVAVAATAADLEVQGLLVHGINPDRSRSGPTP